MTAPALVAVAIAIAVVTACGPVPPVPPPGPSATCAEACARRAALGGCALPTGAECVALCEDATAADLDLGIGSGSLACIASAPSCDAVRGCS